MGSHEITTELESFACLDQPVWEISPPVAEKDEEITLDHSEEALHRRTLESRQHAFHDIWNESLDPAGHRKLHQGKWAKPSAKLFDWKKWPPKYPPFPNGVKIPTKDEPQYAIHFSSGHWEQVEDGVAVVPVKHSNRKLFDDLGGHLNVPRSNIFKVRPPSLFFPNSKVGESYTRKLQLFNTGSVPKRVSIYPPANSAFTVKRHSDPSALICPGFHHTITVTFCPKVADSISESIVFLADKDGSVVVPLNTSVAPQPVLQVEEWNCGCCVVGLSRMSKFEILNVGGDGRFWILSEREFNNEFLDCYVRYNRDLIKDSTRDLANLHYEAFPGFGPSSKSQTKVREPTERTNRKLRARISTHSFRIQPTSFRLQKNQRIWIKVKFQPANPGFNYEKLCILCDNGEVRWIAVKGMGFETNSDKLIELRGPWTGPPIDLPTDPRTKYVLDCGDLLERETYKVQFALFNKSCIPLYFFWTIRPVLPNLEDSPDQPQIPFMDRFYETSVYEMSQQSILYNKDKEEPPYELSPFSVKVSPAQGLIESYQEKNISCLVACPKTLGYHACVISLFLEQVDEESKQTVVAALKSIGEEQLKSPMSNLSLLNGEMEDRKSKQEEIVQLHPIPRKSGSAEEFEEEEEEMEAEYEENVPLKDYIEQVKDDLMDQNQNLEPEIVLPLAVARRSSERQMLQNARQGKVSATNLGVVPDADEGVELFFQSNEEVEEIEIMKVDCQLAGKKSGANRDSINIHYLPDNYPEENDRQMDQGHGVYEDLKYYTENVLQHSKVSPNRTLCPVAEVEIWSNSVQLDITFNPPLLQVTGSVPSILERHVQVKNGTGHDIVINFESVIDIPTGVVTYEPHRVFVKPYESTGFKVFINFKKCGEFRGLLRGFIKLPFATVPCFLSANLRAVGPFLEVLTPFLSFGLVPFTSETMKTIAIRNGGDFPVKWKAQVPELEMEDEDRHELSGHQRKISKKRLLRVWPCEGLIGPGETLGIQVYFCAELTGQICSYIEVLAKENPESLISVPVYAEIELPCLVLDKGLMKFIADDFCLEPVQTHNGYIINPTAYNVHFSWQPPVGDGNKMCRIKVKPKKGTVLSKGRIRFAVTVESLSPGDELHLDDVFLTCCVGGLKEPLVLKIVSTWQGLDDMNIQNTQPDSCK